MSDISTGKAQIWRVYPDMSFTGNLNESYWGNGDHAGCHDFKTAFDAAIYVSENFKSLLETNKKMEDWINKLSKRLYDSDHMADYHSNQTENLLSELKEFKESFL